MLDYKDEKGRILKGFSQVDLNKLNFFMKCLLSMFGVLLLIIMWCLWQIKEHQIVTHIINAIGRC